MGFVRDQIIVLKRTQYAEADLIVTGLNSDGGRITLMAKGALRSRKRFGGGVLDPAQVVEVVYRERGLMVSSDIAGYLSEAQLREAFPGLRESYPRIQTAWYFLELTLRATQHGYAPEPRLFNLLGHALRAAQSVKNLSVLRQQFELKLLHIQGELPIELAQSVLLKNSVHQADEIRSTPMPSHRITN